MQVAPPHGLVALRFGRPPSPDGVCTVRCNCLHGCRRRCPLGRRFTCANCGTLVGPCCGILMPGEQTAEGARASDVVVCHACIGDSPAPPCQWMPPLSDFPLMTAAQTLRWKPVVKLREVQRAELVWRDLSAEALGEAAGADGRCVQCRKYYTPAAADGGYCSACWVSSCCICGCWDQRLVGAKVPERWQCLACLRLPPKNQEYFRVMAAALEASFVPWHTKFRQRDLATLPG